MKKITKLTAAVTAMALASVSAASLATMHFTANAADSEESSDPVGKAYLAGSFGTMSNWDADGDGITIASVTGDGTYTVQWDLSEATSTGSSWFLIVTIEPDGEADNFTTDTFESLEVTLDSVTIDGVAIDDLSGAVINTAYYESGAGTTRIYLHDDWTGTKACVVDDMDIESNITVSFTVSGAEQMVEGSEETTTTTTAAATTTKKTTTKKTTTTTTTTTTTAATDSTDSTSSTDSSYLRGDYDGDGSITINDAYYTLLAYSNISAGKDSGMTETQEAAVDVDENGKVDIQDAYKILLYYSYQSAGKTVDWDSL